MNIINHFKKKSNKDVFKYLIIFGAINISLITFIYLLMANGYEFVSISDSLKKFLALYSQFIIMIIPFWILKTKKEELNLQKSNIFKCLKYSIIAYVYFILINIFLIQTNLINILPGFGQQENIIADFITNKFDMITAGIAICLVAPILEEIVFRGYIYNKFKKSYSVVLSSIFTSIIFASIHFQFNVISSMIILSLIIHWVYEKSNGVYGAITFHILNNTIAFIAFNSL